MSAATVCTGSLIDCWLVGADIGAVVHCDEAANGLGQTACAVTVQTRIS
jgi:hypothetical protein